MNASKTDHGWLVQWWKNIRLYLVALFGGSVLTPEKIEEALPQYKETKWVEPPRLYSVFGVEEVFFPLGPDFAYYVGFAGKDLEFLEERMLPLEHREMILVGRPQKKEDLRHETITAKDGDLLYAQGVYGLFYYEKKELHPNSGEKILGRFFPKQRARVIRVIGDDPRDGVESVLSNDVVNDSYDITSPEVREFRAFTRKLLDKGVIHHEGIRNDIGDMIAVLERKALGSLIDLVASDVPIVELAGGPELFELKQDVLEQLSISTRMVRALNFLKSKLTCVEAGQGLEQTSHEQKEVLTREFYLRGQLKAIQKELGEGEDETAIWYEKKIQETRMSPEAEKEAQEQLKRLKRMHKESSSQERSTICDLLDWLIEYPWFKSTQDNISVADADNILDEDHYAMDNPKDEVKDIVAVEKRKQRIKKILAYAAERGIDAAVAEFSMQKDEIIVWQVVAEENKNKEHNKTGKILAFVGPPGVGKTSLGKSIARALGRKFRRISLGGVSDEAELRGHRRTYVGAYPGAFVKEITRGGSNNPVFMLDEADSTGADYKGDPVGALIEALDMEQNFAFNDHYLGVSVDLSNVLFILTSNTLNYKPALKDRLKVIDVGGYTEEEKIEIANRYLVPKAYRQYWLHQDDLDITNEAKQSIIRLYTNEDGVRELERCIDTICTRTVRRIEEFGSEKRVVIAVDVPNILGTPKFIRHSDKVEQLEPGIAIGMAAVGSATAKIGFVEAVLVRGDKPFTLSMKAGESMLKSLETVSTLLRSENAAKIFDYNLSLFEECHLEYHIDMEDGNDSADGGSVGGALACSGIGAIKKMRFRTDTAITGQVSAYGKFRPIGSLRAKALEARRRGIKRIVLPAANGKDIADIPQPLRDQLEFHCVETVFEAVELCLEKRETIQEQVK